MAEAGEKQTDVAETSAPEVTADAPLKAADPVTENKPAEPIAEKVAEAAVPQSKAPAAAADTPKAAPPLPKKRGRPAKLKTEAVASAAKTPAKKAKPAAKRAPSKPAAAAKRTVAKPATAKTAKPAAATPAVKRAYSPRKPAKTAAAVNKITLNNVTPIKFLKDSPMAKTAPELTATVQGAFKEISTKAKAAYEKGTTMVGDYSEFAKGNVEAVVESTKILATGVQEMGRDYVAESRSAFEAITADVKDLAAVKTPSEFFQLQTALLKKSFDTAVAYGSKNSEMMLKLTNEAFAPLSNRVSVAMEKAKLAA